MVQFPGPHQEGIHRYRLPVPASRNSSYSERCDKANKRRMKGKCTDNEPSYTLYRAYDSDGILLYIGQSISALTRTGHHAKYASWFRYCYSLTFQRYADKEVLAIAEKTAIEKEKPVFNVVHNIAVKNSVDMYTKTSYPTPLSNEYESRGGN